MRKYLYLVVCLLCLSCDFSSAEESFNKGTDFLGVKDYENALKHLNKAIRKKNNYRRALFNRAIVFTHIDSTELAINDYEKIISFDSDNADAAQQIGIIYSDNKNYEMAEKWLTYALKTGGVSESHGRITFNPKVEINSPLFGLNPDPDSDYYVQDLSLYFRRGVVNYHLKEFDKSLEDFLRVSKHKEEDAEVFYQIGKVYVEKEDSINACQNFIKSAKLGLEKSKDMLREHCLPKNE